MRRPLFTCLTTAALVAGCGDDGRPAAVGPGRSTVVVALPAPARTTTPAVIVPGSKAPPTPGAEPHTRDGYLARLERLAARLGPAIDAAAGTGDSTPIARIDAAVMRVTRRWLASGGAASPAATTLAAAIATARTNVESALLAPESRRQVQYARAALAAERGA